MKVVELLKIGAEMLKMMSKHDVFRDDWRYVDMYEAYRNMRDNSVKHLSAIKTLGDDYNVSTRTVERIIKRLSLDC